VIWDGEKSQGFFTTSDREQLCKIYWCDVGRWSVPRKGMGKQLERVSRNQSVCLELQCLILPHLFDHEVSNLLLQEVEVQDPFFRLLQPLTAGCHHSDWSSLTNRSSLKKVLSHQTITQMYWTYLGPQSSKKFTQK